MESLTSNCSLTQTKNRRIKTVKKAIDHWWFASIFLKGDIEDGEEKDDNVHSNKSVVKNRCF